LVAGRSLGLLTGCYPRALWISSITVNAQMSLGYGDMLEQWALRHGVSAAALDELRAAFGCLPVVIPQATGSEALVQSQVRLEAARKGVKLWRNNVGVLLDARSVPVRYGLANDSKRLNEACKSGDLIGWRSVLITTSHLGTRIAQFVSRECKKPGWKYSGDAHERAQLKWAEAIVADGGDAKFCCGEETL